jgi:predicted MPP superfamily phosphohydrolase
MELHSQLILPYVGAIVGLPFVFFQSRRLRRSWPGLHKRGRSLGLATLGVFSCAYVLGVYGFFVEPNLLVVRRTTIVSHNWHGAPLTIAAIGDVHVQSPHVNAARVRSLVARANALDPDLIVLLGDYINGSAPIGVRSRQSRTKTAAAMAAFSAFEARHGVISVLGNHDIWYGRTPVHQALRKADIVVLENGHVVIERSAGRFVVAGLADRYSAKPDFARALAGAPGGADVIVLSHNPDPFARVPADVALMLAAHTHCGQVTIPFIGRLIVPSVHGQRYACRRIDEHGRTMFVTSGVGTSILPVRFLNPPEIALITLKSADPPR